jgi:hypothetical protein
MGDYEELWSLLFLREPLTRERVHTTITHLVEQHPEVRLRDTLDETVDMAFHDTDRWPDTNVMATLDYGDGYRVTLENTENHRGTLDPHLPPWGFPRTFLVTITSDGPGNALGQFLEDPEAAWGFVPVFSTLCRELGAYLAVSDNEADYECEPGPPSEPRACYRWLLVSGQTTPPFQPVLNTLKVREKALDRVWLTLFLDSRLADSIGLPFLREWAGTVQEVPDSGWFVDASGTPFTGEPTYTRTEWEDKREEYQQAIAPALIDRVRREMVA